MDEDSHVFTIREPATGATMPVVRESCQTLGDDTSGLCPVETTPVFSDPDTRSVKQIKEVTSAASRAKRRSSRISVRFQSTQTNNNNTHRPPTSSKPNSKLHPCFCCISRMNQTTRYVLSRLVLTCVLVAYIAVGTILFFGLESPLERSRHEEFSKWKNDTAILLATELRQVKPYTELWIRTVYQYLDSFERDVLQVCRQGYQREREGDHEASQMWTLNSAFLFSVSILTTTGYVGATLQSPWARVVLLVYSAFGIPMMVSWLAAIGGALATLWTWIYKRVCCAIYINRRRKIEPRELHHENHHQYSTASQEYAEQLQANLATPLLPSSGGTLTESASAPHESPSTVPAQEMQPCEPVQAFPEPGHTGSGTVQTQTDQVQKYSPTVEDFVLPTLLSLFIFLLYFIFGSAMVSVQENWTLVDSAYYVYLHFTTLGVGSFQPTPTSKTTYYGSPLIVQHQVLFILYLLLGYCLLSMILCLIFRFTCAKRRRKHYSLLPDTSGGAQQCNGVPVYCPAGGSAART